MAQTIPPRGLRDYEVLPPSPTVAALGSYGAIPVSYHTGLPNISIPLHTISVKGLPIPIALAYQSTGLLVDERASNVGLGWSCTGLSVIGHTVMGGISDFDSGGYCAGAEWREVADGNIVGNGNMQGGLFDFSQNILKKLTDVEPDLYSYSFPGHSGKFVFDRQAIAHSIPYECLKIDHSYIANTSEEHFTLTDEAGNVFYFDGGESSIVTELTPGCGPRDGRHQLSGTTAFYLKRIITPYHDTVNFSYQGAVESYLNPVDLTEYQMRSVDAGGYEEFAGNCDNITPRHDCMRQTDHFTAYLARIQYKNETVDFTYDAPRRDLAGGRMLTAVTVRYAGEVRKQFRLYQSYFQATTPTPLTGPLAEQDNLRLRLDSVQQLGQPPYRFAYHLPADQGFPAVHSYAQDRWGYYNRKISNQTLVTRANNLGANRDADSSAVRVGMLQQLTYPTRGTTTLRYEANTLYRPTRVLDELMPISGLFVHAIDQNEVGRDTTFTIAGDTARTVFITFYFPDPSTLPPNPDGSPNTGSTVTGGSAALTLTNAHGSTIYRAVSGGQTSNVTAPIKLRLLPGIYYLSGTARGGTDYSSGGSQAPTEYWGNLSISAKRLEAGGNQVVGGCRLRQMAVDGRTAYGPVGITRYGYSDEKGRSSGYALLLPTLTSTQVLRHVKSKTFAWGETLTVNVDCTYDVNLQSSANQVGMIAGSPVGYTRVTKLVGPAQGGELLKSVYYYNELGDHNPYSDTYPFPPPTFTYDWFRGKLVREQDYRQTSMGFELAREKRYTYVANYNQMPGQPPQTAPAPHQAIIPGYRVITVMSGQTAGGTIQGTNDFVENKFFRYYYVSASVFLTKTAETVYGTQHDSLSTVTLLSYSHDNLLVNQERTRTSSGDTLVKHVFYYTSPALIPANTTNPRLLALRWQQQHHVLNQPTETVRYRYRTGQSPLALQRSLTLYQQVHNTVVPLREYASPGGLSVRQPWSSVDFQRDSLVYDPSYYPLAIHQRYDGRGNVLQQALPSGRPVTYLYGYGQQLLTAHVQNAAWSQVACTSFEPDATGRWRYDSTGTHRVVGGRTGRWAYQLDGTASVSRRQLPAGGYELTYWVQSSTSPAITMQGGSQLSSPQLLASGPDNWHQFRTRLHYSTVGQVSLDVAPGTPGMRLDELRLYPMGAQLTSYTHDPLVGVTSQTDPTGRTIFYEYDALGRLLRTRDEQGRILSQQQYHYAGK